MSHKFRLSRTVEELTRQTENEDDDEEEEEDDDEDDDDDDEDDEPDEEKIDMDGNEPEVAVDEDEEGYLGSADEETFQLRQCDGCSVDQDALQALRSKRKLKFKRTESSLKRKKLAKKVKMERGHWSNKLDFLLSLLGYSIGLGNVWRFPYLCYKNGGGAFLIPFIVMVFVAGLPLMFMELALGQFSNMGPIILFDKFCPLFAGLGYAMVLVSFIVMLYYNMILAWTLYYMWVSFTSKLPWQTCEPQWAKKECFSMDHFQCLKLSSSNVYNKGICYNSTMAHFLNISEPNVTFRKAPGSEYFENAVLEQTNSIEETDTIRIQMAVSLLFAWIIVYLCLAKGVQSSGKVVYFTALFPFFLLIILFFRGITLPGAKEGILFYITPNFELLFSTQVWGDAAVQIFFALSPAWGGLITLSSYNQFDNNCFSDALIVSLSNILTSIFAGFAVFSIIGYLAFQSDTEVSKVVDQGVGLAFKVYPEVVTKLPFASLWSFLFFLMLFTLGLDSQFALLETVQTALLDRFPKLRPRKEIVLAIVCSIGFLLGLLFTTGSGVYWLQLFDSYASSFSVLFLALLESTIVAWIYGADKFLADIEKMIGPRGKLFKWYWKLNWKYFSPISLVFIIVFSWIKAKPLTIGNYVYPYWANLFGWNLSFVPIYLLIILVIYQFVKSRLNLSFSMKLWILMQPKDSWHKLHRNSSDVAISFPITAFSSSNSNANILIDEPNNNHNSSSNNIIINNQSPYHVKNCQKPLSKLKLAAASSFDNPTFDTKF